MDRSCLVYFPAIIKYTHFIDSQNRSSMKILLLFKTTFTISLAICIYHTVLCSNPEKESSIGEFHNALIISLFLGTGLPMIAKRKQLLELAKFVAEPVVNLFNSYRFLSQHNEFIQLTNAFFFVIAVYVVVFGITLPVLPPLTFLFGGNLASVGSNMWLLANNESKQSFVLVNLLIPLGYLIEVVGMGSWYLLMSCLVLKFQMLVRLMVDGLAALDENANQLCSDNEVPQADYWRLPLCQQCREVQDSSKEFYNIATRRGPQACCTMKYHDNVLERCYEMCLNQVIAQHQAILQFAKLLDSTFCMSVLVFSQVCVITITSYVPKIEKDAFGSKMTVTVFEVIAGIFAQGLLGYWGQTVQEQSNALKIAIYLCSWLDRQVSFKHSLFVHQTIANKSIRLTVGGLYTLNLENFSYYCWSVRSYAKIIQNLRQLRARNA